MRNAILLVLIGALAACGGGGGEGQAPQYSGNTSAATISAAAAPQLASDTLAVMLLAYSAGADVVEETSTDGEIDETVEGTDGGSLRIRGEIRNGRGKLTLTFTDFREGGIVLDGKESIEILEQQTDGAGDWNSRLRHEFQGYTVRDLSDGDSFAVWGSVSATRSRVSQSTTRLNSSIVGEVLLEHSPGGRQQLINEIALTRTLQEDIWTGSGEWEVAGRARVHDSVAGYVDVDIESALLLREDAPVLGPVHGGSAVLTGAGGHRVWISALTRDLVALELDADADGKPDRTLSYLWSSGFASPMGARTNPLAITGPDLWVSGEAGPVQFMLEGRFSVGSGSAFLAHAWTLAFSPPGSTATITDAQTSRASILLDRSGTYLFRLRVSDGTSSSTDYLTVHANFFNGEDVVNSNGPPSLTDRRTARIVLEPDIIAAPGTSTSLDAGRSYTPDGQLLQQSTWTQLELTPDGTFVHPEMPGTTSEAIVPANPTWATFRTSRFQSGHQPSSAFLAMVPATNRLMAPTVELPATAAEGSNNASAEAVADYNGDGIDDFVLVRRNEAELLLRVLLGATEGRLRQLGSALSAPRVTLPCCAPNVTSGDINGDGRMDLLVADPLGVGYFLQTGNTNAPFSAYHVAPSGCSAASRLRFADVDADGDLDVLARHDCVPATSSGLAVYVNTGGQLSPATPIALPGATAWQQLAFVAVDLNADNRADLVASNMVNERTSWLATTTPGTYVAGPVLPPQLMVSTNSWPHVADVDGNGRQDILIPGRPNQILWHAVDGTLTLRTLVIGGGSTSAGEFVTLKDFDGDGLKDILCQGGWYRQTPGAEFPVWQAYSRGSAQAAADINGDGHVDLLNQTRVTLQAMPDGA